MSSQSGDPYAAGAGGVPGEDERMREERAAYEAELSRITVPDMLMQATVSLLNLAAHRLAPEPPQRAGDAGAPGGGEDGAGGAGGRDLEQVRDAIDGVRALLEILERRLPGELRPLRDALSQLQMAYAAEVGKPSPQTQAAQPPGGGEAPGGGAEEPPPGGEAARPGNQEQEERGPGPAESSGRLWVPGR